MKSSEYDFHPEGYISRVNDTGVVYLEECKCHREWRETILYGIKAKKAGLCYNDESFEILNKYNPDTDYLGTESRGNVNKLHRYINNFTKSFEARSSVLYWFGEPGTQKSTMAKWLGLSLIKRGYSVRFLRLQALLEILQPDFENDNTREIDNLTNQDMLILDECFSKNTVSLWKSGSQLAWLSNFLKNRVEDHGKGVIFLSNSMPTAITKEGWPPQLQDFIVREVMLINGILEFKDNFLKCINALGGPVRRSDIFSE